MYDVVIIGAGPSGMVCASKIKENSKNSKVLLLEKNNKLGKKLSITGNGRCNLGNLNVGINNFYSSSNLYRFKSVIESNDYINYLKNIGIYTCNEKERIYPYSNQALTVCKSLERYLKKIGVEIKYEYEVYDVKKRDVFIINDEIKCKFLVIATGGKTYPKTGSDGFGYNMLKKLGLNITKLYPSLTQLKTNYKYIKDLQGIRVDGKVSLVVDNKKLSEETGQIQFTKSSLSGICIFNLSRNVGNYLDNKKNVKVVVNLIPDIKDVKTYIKKFYNYKVQEALSCIINNKLASVIARELGYYDKEIGKLDDDCINLIVDKLGNYEFKITSTGDFETSQVTNGGVVLNEFDDELESIKVEGLFCVGELVDIDAKCGGYNLSWAFNSGLLVAEKIIRKININNE